MTTVGDLLSAPQERPADPRLVFSCAVRIDCDDDEGDERQSIPMSSLNNDVFMGISTFIWSEAVTKEHITQVVLLTHNFELFRQWDVQIERLPGSSGATSKFPSSLYEIRSTHVILAGKTKRRPRLVGWPSTPGIRKKMRSTYQHAFMMVSQSLQELQADDSMERKLDAQLLSPNVVRRMVETFLPVKRSERLGDFTGPMRKSKNLLVARDYVGDADALRLRITRYSHGHSHSETPATVITVSPDEVATAIGAVFEFMNCLDRADFARLCEVVGLDPRAVLPPVPATRPLKRSSSSECVTWRTCSRLAPESSLMSEKLRVGQQHAEK